MHSDGRNDRWKMDARKDGGTWTKLYPSTFGVCVGGDKTIGRGGGKVTGGVGGHVFNLEYGGQNSLSVFM